MTSKPFDREPPAGRLGPESISAGYMILILLGIVVYGFSIVNINYVYVSDASCLTAQILLVSYFIVGVLIIHIGWHLFNRKAMLLSLVWMIVMWTVGSAVLCFLQVLNGHPLAQWIFSAIVVKQLVCLLVVARNHLPLSQQYKVVVTYVMTVVGIVFGSLIALYLAGYRRRGGVGSDGILHQWLGEDLVFNLAMSYLAVTMSALAVGTLMWGITHIRSRWNFFNELSSDNTIDGYLIYIPAKSGYAKGKWGYLPVGSSDFPDPVAFIEEKSGARYFKRKVHRAPIEDFSLLKKSGTEKGVFTCHVSNGGARQVKAFYEEDFGMFILGKWYPYEFEEINKKVE
ncbi:hypothetical protein [Halalkalibacterium halodurans]|uniref:hypothetical protein n=1 Tax=Halalkalibacterium halodurans TaxID=86665 RepID=UPI002AAA4D90|nr:hypothetical protein [Halalkalibacterium halodurans]MDY7224609.1 hypothetical protein [Halalkalibacterium halodurans]MDY7240732.1 hypothetical protein [Halalkalibacterium halodurans]